MKVWMRQALMGLALGGAVGACGTAPATTVVPAEVVAATAPSAGEVVVATSTWPLHSAEGEATLELPVVAAGLPPAVMARINEQLTGEAVLGSTVATIQKEYAECSCGTVGSTVGPEWQRSPVLSLSVAVETMGAYPDMYVVRLVFDTETGARLEAGDLFEPAQQAALVAALDARLRPMIAEAQARARREDAEDVAESLGEAQFTADDLAAFLLSDEGVSFGWSAGLPHYAAALEPDRPVVLTWAEAAPYLTARYQGLAAEK